MSVSLPSFMQAMVLTRHGDYDALAFTHEFPTPAAHRDEVVIQVHACGLNNTDINTRTAWYSKGVTSSTVGGKQEDASDSDASCGGVPIHFPRIQGADVCGTVVALNARFHVNVPFL